MKKRGLALWLILTLLLMVIPAFAADSVEGSEENPENAIVIRFAVGDSTLSINGKDVTVETPYIVDGTTLVPVRVITEAFGADVDWDDTTKTAIVSYGDAVIRLTIGSLVADVNGRQETLLAAPELTNNVTMLPLRFITETFGADVSWDDGKIKVIKEQTVSNSIKDYAMLLKRSTKQRVGDSYYNWSMDRPSELKLTERSFDGRFNVFDSTSRDLTISISMVMPGDDMTIDDYLEDLRQQASGKTTMKLEKDVTKTGIEYVVAQYQSNGYLDNRVYVTDEQLYLLSSGVSPEAGKEAFDDLTAIVDSFDLNFQTEIAEDLSDVDIETGMRTFEDRNLKFQMLIPGNLWENLLDASSNHFYFFRFNDDGVVDESVSIGVFSSETGSTYADWCQNDYERNRGAMNPEMATFTEPYELTVDGKPAMAYDYTLVQSSVSTSTKDIFIDAGNYYYNIAIEANVDTDYQAIMKTIIDSIEIGEIDADEIGRLIRTDEMGEKATKRFKHTSAKYSLEAPIDWECETSNDGSMLLYYDADYSAVAISRFSKAQITGSLKELVDGYLQELKQDESITLIDNEVSSSLVGGISAYHFLIEDKDETGRDMVTDMYFFISGDYIYLLSTQTPKLGYGEATKETFDKIRESFKIEL